MSEFDVFRLMAEENAALAAPPLAERFVQQPHERAANLEASGILRVLPDADYTALVRDEFGIVTPALDAVRRWHNIRTGSASRPMTFMLIAGLTGRGKTLALAWLLARYGGRYVQAETLARLADSKLRDDRVAFEQMLDERVLLIDDLGTENSATLAAAAFTKVVNERQREFWGKRPDPQMKRAVDDLRHLRWTAMSSNLYLKHPDTKANEFLKRYDERTLRRIEHQGAAIQVAGPDLRRLSMQAEQAAGGTP